MVGGTLDKTLSVSRKDGVADHVAIRYINNMKLKVILEPSDEGGFTAIVPSLPGCISEGDSKEDAIKNIREAIELYLEPVDDDSTYPAESEQLEIAV